MNHNKHPGRPKLSRVERARLRLLFDAPFFGSILMNMRLERMDRQGICTDGKILWYNDTFLSTYTDAEVAGILAHEACHIALLHHIRQHERDHALFNVACDYAINGELRSQRSFKLPDDALYEDKFRGKDAEAIYTILASRQIKAQQEGQDDDGQSEGGMQDGDGGGQGGQDDTEDDQDGQDMGSESKSQGDRHGRTDDSQDDTDATVITVPAWSEVQESQDKSLQAEGEAKIEVERAMAVAASYGIGTGEFAGMVRAAIEPDPDPIVLLRDFMQRAAHNDYTKKRPNRRFISTDCYLPSLINNELKSIAVAIDTSGSISGWHKELFHGMMKTILEEFQGTEIHIIHFDDRIKAVDVCADLDEFEFKDWRGGGTDFRPVVNYIEREGLDVAALVYLTDLEGPYPRPDATDTPILWFGTPGSRWYYEYYVERGDFPGEYIEMKAAR